VEDRAPWIVGYEWRRRSHGGEIPPSAVQTCRFSDGRLEQRWHADTYWDNNLTLRRMDDAGSVTNPLPALVNWGGTIYWAVRKGRSDRLAGPIVSF